MIVKDAVEREWIKLEQVFYKKFKKKPDVEAALMLIGIQELHNSQRVFSKEEKQDLMHIAICTVLSPAGYYKLKEYDQEGWPHFDKVKSIPKYDPMEQERFLKKNIVQYFKNDHILNHY